MKLSVCIITKNEKDALEHCLQQLSGYGFELVVVDTGSTDGTIQMASKYTSSIYRFDWCDDFAKAKNFAVAKAKYDQALVIDSDEYVRSIDLEHLEELIVRFPGAVGRIERINQIRQGNEIRESKEYINRLFDRRYYHYEGSIHEQLVEVNGGEYPTFLVPIVIDHSGYFLSEEERIQKAQRNIKLLEKELEKEKEDPYILYQLGKSYYMIGIYDTACTYFSRALSYDLNPTLEYVIDMVDCYGYALLNSGQAQQALAFRSIYEEFGGRADFQFLMGLIYMNNELFVDAIAEFLKAAQQKDCRIKGVNGYLAYYNAGVIYECLGDKKKAMDLYEKCGGYELAQKRMEALEK